MARGALRQQTAALCLWRRYYMLQLKNVTKVYDSAISPVQALRGVSIEFRESEFVSILGPSGCGKTTLLNIIGG